MTKVLLILQILATFWMTGIIWLIQLVQYPSFSEIKPENFQKFHASHTFWITPVVAPMMILELITSILLIFYPPQNIDYKLLWLGLILTLLLWLSTFFIQVPLHNKLADGFDAQTHSLLVNTNWVRTIIWSLRMVLVIYLVWKFVKL